MFFFFLFSFTLDATVSHKQQRGVEKKPKEGILLWECATLLPHFISQTQ